MLNFSVTLRDDLLDPLLSLIRAVQAGNTNGGVPSSEDLAASAHAAVYLQRFALQCAVLCWDECLAVLRYIMLFCGMPLAYGRSGYAVLPCN